jgi:hypothetical protein
MIAFDSLEACPHCSGRISKARWIPDDRMIEAACERCGYSCYRASQSEGQCGACGAPLPRGWGDRDDCPEQCEP